MSENPTVKVSNSVEKNTIKKIEKAIDVVCDYIEKTCLKEELLYGNEIFETTKALAELVSARAQLTEFVMH